MKCMWIITWCFVFALIAFVLGVLEFFDNITNCLEDISQCLGNDVKLHAHVGLDEYEIIEKYGYQSEQHYVTTDDGYILEICRIIPAPGGAKTKNTSFPQQIFQNLMATTPGEPVLVMPGFALGAHSYLIHDAENTLPFLLVNHGYDVFLANIRGTTRSRRHVTLDPEKNPKEFFDYSWHEIGVLDQPALIDYVLALTGFSQLSFVGYSQGGTSLLAMGASRPEYNSKVKIAFNLGGPGPMKYTPNAHLIQLANLEKHLKEISEAMEIYEILKYMPGLMDFTKMLIDENYGLKSPFKSMMNIVKIANSNNLDFDILPALTTVAPMGASVKTIFHYMQSIKHGDFRMYDYSNKSLNVEKYGTDVPPRYNLSAITCPVVMYYSNYDFFVQSKDVQLMVNQMPNATSREINVKKFSHIDYLFSKNIGNILFKDILWRLRF